MKNILVATDLAANSDRALERAVMIAHEHKSRLHVIHVTPSYISPDKKKKALSFRNEAESLLKDYLARYKEAKTLSVSITVAEVGSGFIAAEIIAFSEKVKADLIVVGTHGKAKFRDLFIGTTTERVIRIGSRPILMVRNKPVGAYKNLLVGTDFSHSSQKALHVSASIAPRANFRIIHSYDFPDTEIGMRINQYAGDVIEKLEKEKLQKFMDENKNSLKKYDISAGKISTALIQGQADTCLAKEAKKIKADLLAIGVHGRSGLVSAKLGGTAAHVLSDPPCDILVAK